MQIIGGSIRNEETKNRPATEPMQIVLEELIIRCHPLEHPAKTFCVTAQSMNLFQDPQNCNKGFLSLYQFCFFSVIHYFSCYSWSIFMLSYFFGLLLKILVKTHGFIRNSGYTKTLMIYDIFGKSLFIHNEAHIK